MSTARAQNFDAYKDTEILTANQGKLIVMLYEGAIRFLRTATENMNHQSYDVVNTNVIKAQDIVTELMLSLNMDDGGEIAQNLFNLYAYIKKRLLEANIQKDVGMIDEVIGLLQELRAAWEEASVKEGGKLEPAPVEHRERGASFSIQG